MDFGALVAAADFSDCAAALLSIAALMVSYRVVGWGARKVLDFIDSRDPNNLSNYD